MPDVEMLARIQFAFTIMFHYLFPPLTIGLGWIMFTMELKYHLTKNPIYEVMARYWTRIFAITFALGVASGIVMEFQFGTNWATYSRFVGDVFGSALAAEGIFAFFLESGFLAVLVFGWDRVSPRFHLLATFLVASGATFSAVWIVVANSWQQTPAGFHIVGEGENARAEITNFWEMVFNPSSMHRLNHVLLGCFILAAFVVMSISAWYILKQKHQDFAKRSFNIALVFALITSVLILFSGHKQAQTVAVTQPAKLAAFEGHFTTMDGPAPLYLMGIPSEKEERVKMGIAIPGMLSFLVHGDFSTPVTALDSFPPEDRPPVFLPFMTYHIMVAIGMACIALTLLAAYYSYKGTLFEKRWLMWIFVFFVIAPYIGNQFGWAAAEIGRQPWIVYGLLRTGDAISPSVSGGQVLGSLIMFSLIYTLLLVLYIYVMNDKIQHGPIPEVLGMDLSKSHTDKHGTGFLDSAVLYADPAGPSLTETDEGENSEEIQEDQEEKGV